MNNMYATIEKISKIGLLSENVQRANRDNLKILEMNKAFGNAIRPFYAVEKVKILQTNSYKSIEKVMKAMSRISNMGKLIENTQKYQNIQEILRIHCEKQELFKVIDNLNIQSLSVLNTQFSNFSDSIEKIQKEWEASDVLNSCISKNDEGESGKREKKNYKFIRLVKDVCDEVDKIKEYDFVELQEEVDIEASKSEVKSLVESLVEIKEENFEQSIYKEWEKIKTKHPIYVGVFLCVIFPILLSIIGSFIYSSITSRSSKLHTEPEGTSEVIITIPENSQVVIEENIKYYYKVTYYESRTGEMYEGYLSKRSIKGKE